MGSMEFAYGVCLMLTCIYPVSAITGYDCEEATTKIGTFSLDLVPNCTFSTSGLRTESLKVQILQERKFEEIKVYRCRVKMSYFIYNCGFDSLTYIASVQLEGELIDLDRENCESAVKDGAFITPYGLKKVSGLKKNSAGVINVDLMGHSTKTGHCKGIHFNHKGTDYKNHVLKATIDYLFFEETASWDKEDGTISFQGGLAAPYMEGKHFDGISGNFYWREKSLMCSTEDNYDVLYQGVANRTQDENGESILTVALGAFIFATKMKGTSRACGMSFHENHQQ